MPAAAAAAALAALEPKFIQFLAGRPRIILGSASSSRQLIMHQLLDVRGVPLEIQTAGIDEKVQLAHAGTQAHAQPSAQGGGSHAAVH